MAGKQKGMRKHNSDNNPVKVLCTTLASILLAYALFAGGCNNGNKTSDSIKTPTDLRKAELLSKLDHRFENPVVHYELGHIYQDDGLWAKAQYHYGVALTFDPSHRPAQAAMVKTLLESRDDAKSRLSADIYMDQVSGSAAESTKLAIAFQKEGLDEYALAAYKQGLRLAPSSAKINRQIGYYYLGKNNIELAKEYLSRSFQLDPNQPDVAGELGRLGIEVRIPRSQVSNPKKIDKIVDTESTKENNY